MLSLTGFKQVAFSYECNALNQKKIQPV